MRLSLGLGLPYGGKTLGFSPLSLSPFAFYLPEPQYLFQEEDGTGAVSSDGMAVGYMADLSGNGHHLVQATAGSRPLYKTAGGLHWLEFDGVDDRLTALFSLSQPINRVGAYRYITLDTNYRILVGGGTDGNNGLLSLNGNSLRMFAGIEAEIATTPAAGTDFVATELFNGASSKGAVDNGAYANVNPSTAAADGITLGDQGSTGGAANCRFYGLVQRGSAFADGEVALLRTYLAAKQGRVL